ncbi:hypothetical protein GOL41_05830 [Sinorhizobium medicae]|uniref:Transposase n=2 Tax=Sinorhizobium medicae TaxID=110321 RepID=A0ABX4TP65_9HYPH|nr:hypothetical protein [Sinorhizobium medicae]MDX0454024.1 hypothetical protein [Sinorhizobium medicae]MDX0467040.1 hypothetical protein [Sinorhizobium medicae]MDX0472449.1 hypothetical protein [Sinorhizobium medicae]MDX0504064.1 hypothetical protein [Sinorhizobium medicae]
MRDVMHRAEIESQDRRHIKRQRDCRLAADIVARAWATTPKTHAVVPASETVSRQGCGAVPFNKVMPGFAPRADLLAPAPACDAP